MAGGGIAPFGYIALEQLDQPWQGGNGDGKIDASDAIYGELCLWTDLDQDGETDENELTDLRSAGVVALEVEPATYPRRDAAGNLLLYHADAWLETQNGVKKTSTTDVFFVEQEP